MTGSSYVPAYNYLAAGIPAAITAADPGVQFIDAWGTPVPRMFVLGRESITADGAGSGTDSYTILGAQRLDEKFDIPGFIQVTAGGTDPAEARNGAAVIWDAFVAFLASDLSLGGALRPGGQGGGYAVISSYIVEQTGDAEQAGGGRMCRISFTLSCSNSYIPGGA